MAKPTTTVAALAAALALPLSLAGCSTGPSRDESVQLIESSVTSVSHVTGAYVGLVSSGPSGDGILINVYTDSDELDDLVAAADGSIKAAWTASPFRPVFIHISLAPVPKPANADSDEPAAIDPAGVAAELNIDGAKVVHEIIMIPARDLAAHYGERPETAE